jgi:hypothetical protein
MKKSGVAGAAVLAVLVLAGSFVLGSGGGQSACGATAADSSAASTRAAIDGYAGDQLANAAAIMNAGAALGLDTTGQVIGIMTAMGESSLKNLTYGDTAGPDSRGLFQQRDSWGSLSQRMNPTTAATLFFQRLVNVPGWRQMPPSAAAHAVQRNADPNHYNRYFTPAQAVVAGLIGGDAACAAGISGNAQALAQNLVTAMDAGKVVGAVPDPTKQIRAIAEGKAVENCGVDTRILQVITIAYNAFGKIGISSINRKCTGQILGAGANSAHYVKGGGHAVDFYSLGGVATNGADANALKLLRALDPVMPKGSGTGQVDCRAKYGTSTVLAHMVQFDDSCTHVHVQVNPNNDVPLNLG